MRFRKNRNNYFLLFVLAACSVSISANQLFADKNKSKEITGNIKDTKNKELSKQKAIDSLENECKMKNDSQNRDAANCYMKVSILYTEVYEPDKAIEFFNKALPIADNSHKNLAARHIAGLYSDREEWDKAKSWFVNALEYFPSDLHSIRSYGYLVAKSNTDYKTAYAFIDKAMEIYSGENHIRERAELFYDAAGLKQTEKKYKEAIDFYKKSEALESKEIKNHVGFWVSYSYTYFQIKNLDMAIEKGLKALEVDPRYWVALWLMGNYHWLKEDFPKAKSYLLKAIEVNPFFVSFDNIIEVFPEKKESIARCMEFMKQNLPERHK